MAVSSFIHSGCVNRVFVCNVIVIVFFNDVIVVIAPSVLVHVVHTVIIAGIGEDHVRRKHERGFVNVKVRGVLGVVSDGVVGFLFLVVETFVAFPGFMAWFLAIATRSGIAIARRAGLRFPFSFFLALKARGHFAFAFTLWGSFSLLSFVSLALGMVLMLVLTSATAVAISPPIHDGGRVVGEGRLVFGVDKLSDVKVRVALETLVCE